MTIISWRMVDDSAEALTGIEMETEVEMQGVGDESCSESSCKKLSHNLKKLQEEIY